MITPEALFSVSPVVPVIAVRSVERALKLAEALAEGGVHVMEVTLRTEAALASIEAIAKAFPTMHVGAGTVIDAAGIDRCLDHGAQFAFSPGVSESMLDAAREKQFTLIPGVATASEVMIALNRGVTHAKLFPAEAVGGVRTLKAFAGPFQTMRFCPTGGVGPSNLTEYLSLENVACVGGSWIVPDAAIEAGDFGRITALCREALALAQLR